ncbi:hypothetical protein GEMRC1_012435 [Eukaryota sp. GEM-RC1]
MKCYVEFRHFLKNTREIVFWFDDESQIKWNQHFIEHRRLLRSFEPQLSSCIDLFLSTSIQLFVNNLEKFKLFLPAKSLGTACSNVIDKYVAKIFQNIGLFLAANRRGFMKAILNIDVVPEKIPSDSSISQRIASKFDNILKLSDIDNFFVKIPFPFSNLPFFSGLFAFTASIYSIMVKVRRHILEVSFTSYYDDFYSVIKQPSEVKEGVPDDFDTQSNMITENSVVRSRRGSIVSSVLSFMSNNKVNYLAKTSNLSTADLMALVHNVVQDLKGFAESLYEVMTMTLSKFVEVSRISDVFEILNNMLGSTRVLVGLDENDLYLVNEQEKFNVVYNIFKDFHLISKFCQKYPRLNSLLGKFPPLFSNNYPFYRIVPPKISALSFYCNLWESLQKTNLKLSCC